ncbi:MAG TPA: potassium transporter Kup, partial [Oligoflexia bacterium]|nr:potassium transporter Kup [Oligoflexia bacterium]
IHRVVFHYGFMESPNIPGLLGDPERMGFEIDLSDTTFFFGRESVVAAGSSGMMRWREDLFRMLSQNAQRAMVFYGIPSAQVVEIGFQIEL